MNFRNAIAVLLSKYNEDTTSSGSKTSFASTDNVYAEARVRGNPCRGAGTKALDSLGWTRDIPCQEAIERGLGQSGADVTVGYVGGLDVGDTEPFTEPFSTSDMCTVNVHWHVGAEHRSQGEYDEEEGRGPIEKIAGLRCRLYDQSDEKFTKGFDWEHCIDMEVGETYEVHWPHSSMGACDTKYQYQSPFTDGVFCHAETLLDPNEPIPNQVGVQAQVFTIVNDDSDEYYWDNLIDGMVVDEDLGMGIHITKYTGSTTGPIFNNDERCDDISPITWQVDRKCHLISASSFDKMCADMKKHAGMKSCGGECEGDVQDKKGCCYQDVTPAGHREVVTDELAADNQVNRNLRNP